MLKVLREYLNLGPYKTKAKETLGITLHCHYLKSRKPPLLSNKITIFIRLSPYIKILIFDCDFMSSISQNFLLLKNKNTSANKSTSDFPINEPNFSILNGIQ